MPPCLFIPRTAPSKNRTQQLQQKTPDRSILNPAADVDIERLQQATSTAAAAASATIKTASSKGAAEAVVRSAAKASAFAQSSIDAVKGNGNVSDLLPELYTTASAVSTAVVQVRFLHCVNCTDNELL